MVALDLGILGHMVHFLGIGEKDFFGRLCTSSE